MSINDDEWYYGEDNQRWVPKGEASRYMRGEGFDEENDPFRSSDDFDVSRVGQSVEPCQCDLSKISKAANDLLVKLQHRPAMFPRDQSQFDSLALGINSLISPDRELKLVMSMDLSGLVQIVLPQAIPARSSKWERMNSSWMD